MKLSILNYKKCLLVCGSVLSLTANVNAAGFNREDIPEEDNGNTSAQSTSARSAPEVSAHQHDVAEDFNLRNGDTSDHRTETRGNVEALIAAGADVNAKDEDGMTPLHWPAIKNYADKIELLIAAGADVNAKDEDGMTPLHFAVSNHNPDATELLIANGADVKVLSHLINRIER